VTLDAHKVAAARLWASARMPYLASALFACTIREDVDCGTISIDPGWQIDADPAVVERLDVDDLGRLLLHLAGHVIRDHATRAGRAGGERLDRARWNRAADAEINDDLADDDSVPAVAPDTPEDLGCEPGALAEHYYEHGDDGPRHWDCGAGADGRPCRRGGLDDAQGELLRLGVAAAIQAHDARLPGSVPGGWTRWAETVLPSRVDWRRVLAAEIRSAVAATTGKVDYSYRRPSRRAHATPGIVLPTLQRPIPEVAIVCDTSGSMHERLLARSLAEVEGILTRAGLRQTRVRVLAVDTAVHTATRVNSARQVQLVGGGGTDMGAGIAGALALRPRPTVVIVLTDGYTPWPNQPPRNAQVVVGLLTDGGAHTLRRPPAWARTVVIEDS
jgi:predicted metal-dependent peptidase